MKLNLTESGLFSGLYNTIWLNEYSEVGENFNKTLYLELIADAYIEYLTNKFQGSKWKLDYVASPSYYNFDTDHIILNWTNAPENANQIIEEFLNNINENFELDVIYYNYLGSDILPQITE